MNARIFQILLSCLVLSMTFSCNKKQLITLEVVRELPEYIHEATHFGKDLKSMEELNKILLVIGRIDTTSESPPLQIAVIKINQQLIILNLDKENRTLHTFNQEYSGNGYMLSLTNKEKDQRTGGPVITVIIKNGKLESNYSLVGVNGYR